VIGIVRHDVEMTATVIRAEDQDIAHASGAHLSKGDLLLAGHLDVTITRPIATHCAVRFFQANR
jgi:hypothetical protein